MCSDPHFSLPTLEGLQEEDLGKSCMRVWNFRVLRPTQGQGGREKGVWGKVQECVEARPFGPEGGVGLDEGPDPRSGLPLARLFGFCVISQAMRLRGKKRKWGFGTVTSQSNSLLNKC